MQQVLRQLDEIGGDLGAAKHVLKKFNSYLATECNTATARARTAKQWAEFMDEGNKSLFPNLRWLPPRSAEPREAHRQFWNRIWAKDDPFWKNNFPGNIWNCKCDWEETTDQITSKNPKGIPPDGKVAPGIGTNPKDGEIFDNTNVYHQSAPPELKQPAVLALGEEAYYPSPINPKIKVHPMHTDTEIVGNTNTAAIFLKHNPEVKEVKILPNVVKKDEQYRPYFYPKGMMPRGENKNADAVVTWNDDKFWLVDYKYMGGNGSTIIKRLNEAYEQADYAIIKLNESLTSKLIEQIERWFRL